MSKEAPSLTVSRPVRGARGQNPLEVGLSLGGEGRASNERSVNIRETPAEKNGSQSPYHSKASIHKTCRKGLTT